MLFNTPQFMVFLLLVFCLYYAVPRLRLIMMAVANAGFYAFAGFGYLLLFIVIVCAAYGLSRWLRGQYGRWALYGGIAIVLSNLLFFKYSLFLAHNVERVLGFRFAFLRDPFFTEMILPLGISFYSFQLIAYLVDVYKGRLAPSRNVLEFWVFISLFAHSAAGPILRGKDFLPQLRDMTEIAFNPVRFKLGMAYLGMGLMKKMLLADQISPYVDGFFARGASLTGGEAWIAAYLFAFQIYFDFSAYSEMAVGIGHLLGLRLDINFRTPYISGNATEFWRRWHITLSTWIRDYIYIPLGGSRLGKARTYMNLIAAMAISGLWHGAAWTFVIWGVYHGLLSAGHKLYKELLARFGFAQLATGKIYQWLAVFVFFHLTTLGWVLFRAKDIHIAAHMIKEMLLANPLHSSPELLKYFILIALLYALHVLEYAIISNFRIWSLAWQLRIAAPVRALVYSGVIIIVLLMFMKGGKSSFIYFQF